MPRISELKARKYKALWNELGKKRLHEPSYRAIFCATVHSLLCFFLNERLHNGTSLCVD